MRGKVISLFSLILTFTFIFYSPSIFSQNQPHSNSQIDIDQSVYNAVQLYILSGNPLKTNGTLDYHKITQYADSIRSALETGSMGKVQMSTLVVSYTSAIQGTVYESDGITPIAYTSVRVFNENHQQAGWNQTNSQGQYSVGNLGAGQYYVKADGYAFEKGNHYYEQYYNMVTSQGDATFITVTGEDTANGIDFQLNRKGSISGRITDEEGQPIVNTMVTAYNTSGGYGYGAQTDGNGYYTIYCLTSGGYNVHASGYIVGEGEFFLEEYYNNSPTVDGAASVSVSEPNNTPGIDFVLTRGFHVWAQVDPSWVGWVEISPQKLVYAPGDIVNLQAVLGQYGDNYYFDHWEGDTDGPNNPTEIVMNSDKEVIAVFREYADTTFQLNINNNPLDGGIVVRNPEQAEYDSGAVVHVTADAHSGWEFMEWSGDLSGNTNPNEIVMNANKSVTANFGHTLDVTILPQGKGTVEKYPPQEIYSHGSYAQLFAQAQDGYIFDCWDGDTTSTEEILYLRMNANKHVYAKFKPAEVTLEMKMIPEESGIIAPEVGLHGYEIGEVVMVTAYAKPGYQFVRWEGDVEHPENYYTTVTMDENKVVKAIFEESLVTLQMKIYPENAGSTSPEVGPHSYQLGEVVTVSAEAADGYAFIRWEGSVENPYEATTTITMNENKIVKAKFEEFHVTLEMKVYPEGSGTTDPTVGTYTYPIGDTVSISAQPADGYAFLYWEGAVAEPTQPTTTVNMNECKIVKAKFQQTHVTLEMKVYPQGSGTTSPSIGLHTYEKGETVNIVAEPEQGYQFVKWEGPVADPYSSSTTITMHENKIVKAKFEESHVTLQMMVYPEGSGTTNPTIGTHTYSVGETVTISAQPADGYAFLYWEGAVAEPTQPATTVNMNECKIVKAKFQQTHVTLEMKVYPQGSGTTSPSIGLHTYEKGETVNIVAEPEQGYQFIKWEGSVADPYSESTSITLNENKIAKAKFGKIYLTLEMKVNPEGSGWTSPQPGIHHYEIGDIVDITAEPKEGYQFQEWIGPVADNHNIQTTVVIEQSTTVKALFVEKDENPPIITQFFPHSGAHNVPKNTKIQIKGKDKESGIDVNSIQLWVNGNQIIYNGQDQTNGEVFLNCYGCHFKIAYEPNENFEEGSIVEVVLSVNDQANPPNTYNGSSSFTVGKTSIGSNEGNPISQGGGQVTNSDSNIVITVPAEALEDTVEITINPADSLPELPEKYQGLPLGYHFGPDGLQFNKPVLVKLTYTPEMLIAAGVSTPYDLKIYYYHTTTGEWVELTVESIDEDSLFIQVYVDQFCYFTMGKNSTTAVHDEIDDNQSPKNFHLYQNSPNPFNPETRIRYEIDEPSHVDICIFNSYGQQIRTLVDREVSSGMHELIWDARNDEGIQVSSGFYIVRMVIDGQVLMRKISFIK